MIEFFVPGEPVAKGRPRFARRTGHTYTPASTVMAENLVRVYAHEAMMGGTPMEGPVAVTIIAKLSIPKSWSNKRRAMASAGMLWPTKKPDVDNLSKTFTDAMNGIVYSDDKQIIGMRVVKMYDEKPGTSVEVYLVDETAETLIARGGLH